LSSMTSDDTEKARLACRDVTVDKSSLGSSIYRDLQRHFLYKIRIQKKL
jgi:hypothetical protein